MEHEIVTRHQANLLMLLVFVIAPLVGFLWGRAAKRAKEGVTIGLLIGVGNMILWAVYNKITNHLGLDTVKNLLVNIILFIVIGILAGFAAARLGAKAGKERNE